MMHKDEDDQIYVEFNHNQTLRSIPFEDVNIFRCSICPYKTIHKVNLTAHQRVHTGDRPFKCDQCPYSATQKGNLVKHQRIHSGEKPFKCNLCPFRATQQSTIATHQRVHYQQNKF